MFQKYINTSYPSIAHLGGMRKIKPAFSLVEMLMALLVASLLLAALAPVMTRKFGENLNISGVGGGSKGDYTRVWYYDESKEYQEWNIPNGVNVVKITSIGGGGAGGGSTYGFKVFTTDETWQVPAGVTKLRVFMVGGGGAGASGGISENTLYESVNLEKCATASSCLESITQTGVSNWNTSSAMGNVPALHELCKKSGVTKWTIAQDNTRFVAPSSAIVYVRACGGGGGGGAGYDYVANNILGGSGGGSGGYVNNYVGIAKGISSISITVGGGGGGGGTDDGTNGQTASGWGGGGGGTESYKADGSDKHIAKGVVPGGDGGWVSGNCGGSFTAAQDGKNASGSSSTGGGSSGGGSKSSCGGFYAGQGSAYGGGGGGAGCTGGSGGGGGGATFFGRYANSTTDDKEFFLVAPGGGGGSSGARVSSNKCPGGGGGGVGGGIGGSGASNVIGGGGGGLYGFDGNESAILQFGKGGKSPIGNANYCAGGDGGNSGTSSSYKGKLGTNGKNGYMEISWGPFKDALKCTYFQEAIGSGGGGSGQIWLGEISVSGGQELNIKVGNGGVPSTLYGSSGGDGGTTSIKVASSIEYKVLGGEGGKYIDTGDSSALAASVGAGWGVKTAGFINWTNIEDDKINVLNNNKNGGAGNLISNGAGGGKGGNSMDRFGNVLTGGLAGNAQSNGADAPVSNYGAGGGGGGGVITEGAKPGFGGKGAPGYVYIEWGSTNGGGGASGQVATQQNVWVTPNTVMKIYIGKGGSAKPLTEIQDKNGNINGYKGEDGENGSESYVIVKDGTNDKKEGIAKGGFGGYAGSAKHGLGGNIKTVASGSYDENNIETIMENSAYGTSGKKEYGGNGGTLTEELCPLLSSILKAGQTSLGGCGGNVTSAGGALCYTSLFANGKGNDGTGIGAGGGGGAVINNSANKGGNGAPGAVMIEWSN